MQVPKQQVYPPGSPCGKQRNNHRNSQDGGSDRENWAGHMCRGRDRFTITFQLIKNQHTPDCNGQVSLGQPGCAPVSWFFTRVTLTTLLVNVICLRTFRGITQDTGSQVERVVATAGRTRVRFERRPSRY